VGRLFRKVIRLPEPETKPAGRKLLGRKKKARGARPPGADEPGPNARRTLFVVNPSAGAGDGARIWDELVTTFRDLGVDFEFQLTEKPEHAIEIARKAAEEGFGTVVAVGGDGTVFEVTNGLMAVERSRRPRLGVIPTGRHNDLCRTLGIPLDRVTAASFLASGNKRTIDLGWIEYVASDGVRTAYFTNVAGLGFEGEVSKREEGLPERVARSLGATATRLFSTLVTFATYKDKDIDLTIDGEVRRVLATSCMVANGRYTGGKMCVAPEAAYDDGLFDVVVIGAGHGSPVIDVPEGSPAPSYSALQRGVAKAKAAIRLPAVYRGTHVEDESVMVLRGGKVKISSTDRMVLEADGEILGEGPLTAEVIARALDVIA
jgi:diacylglycerol kinase (ATP)